MYFFTSLYPDLCNKTYAYISHFLSQPHTLSAYLYNLVWEDQVLAEDLRNIGLIKCKQHGEGALEDDTGENKLIIDFLKGRSFL